MSRAMKKSVGRAHRGAHRGFAYSREQAEKEEVERRAREFLNVSVGPKPSVKPERASSALKHLDIVAFNMNAERIFVDWLTDRLTREEFGAVSISWVISNAAYGLDVSPETVKRYLLKHCADDAPFVVEAGMVRLKA